MDIEPIFPEIVIERLSLPNRGGGLSEDIVFKTVIRKNFDGVWYKSVVKQRFKSNVVLTDRNYIVKRDEVYKRFVSACYTHLIFSQYTDIQDSFGKPMYEVDEDQRTEEERLRSTIIGIPL